MDELGEDMWQGWNDPIHVDEDELEDIRDQMDETPPTGLSEILNTKNTQGMNRAHLREMSYRIGLSPLPSVMRPRQIQTQPNQLMITSGRESQGPSERGQDVYPIDIGIGIQGPEPTRISELMRQRTEGRQGQRPLGVRQNRGSEGGGSSAQGPSGVRQSRGFDGGGSSAQGPSGVRQSRGFDGGGSSAQGPSGVRQTRGLRGRNLGPAPSVMGQIMRERGYRRPFQGTSGWRPSKTPKVSGVQEQHEVEQPEEHVGSPIDEENAKMWVRQLRRHLAFNPHWHISCAIASTNAVIDHVNTIIGDAQPLVQEMERIWPIRYSLRRDELQPFFHNIFRVHYDICRACDGVRGLSVSLEYLNLVYREDILTIPYQDLRAQLTHGMVELAQTWAVLEEFREYFRDRINQDYIQFIFEPVIDNPNFGEPNPDLY